MSQKTPLFPKGHDSSTGPYSPGLRVDDLVFVSGQGPLDLQTGEVVGETIAEQVEATLRNVESILVEAGCSLADCVKVTVHLSDIANYPRFNEAYAEFFSDPYPARTLVQSVLWQHILVEIDVIAIKHDSQ